MIPLSGNNNSTLRRLLDDPTPRLPPHHGGGRRKNDIPTSIDPVRPKSIIGVREVTRIATSTLGTVRGATVMTSTTGTEIGTEIGETVEIESIMIASIMIESETLGDTMTVTSDAAATDTPIPTTDITTITSIDETTRIPTIDTTIAARTKTRTDAKMTDTKARTIDTTIVIAAGAVLLPTIAVCRPGDTAKRSTGTGNDRHADAIVGSITSAKSAIRVKSPGKSGTGAKPPNWLVPFLNPNGLELSRNIATLISFVLSYEVIIASRSS